jgi:N-ethylmaleimide reductase
MEVVEIACEIWGPDRVGVRLSPLGKLNDIADAEPEATFGAIAQALNEFHFAYLHLVNPAVGAIEKGDPPDARAERMLTIIREKYRGTLIVAGGFDRDTAEAWLEQGKADLIAFGRKFIANPDLPDRLRARKPLNADDPSTYYGGGEKGYTDYPSLAQERGEQPKACVDEQWR